jgi:hypothetical protein
VVDEVGVLLRIEDFQQSRGRIAVNAGRLEKLL